MTEKSNQTKADLAEENALLKAQATAAENEREEFLTSQKDMQERLERMEAALAATPEDELDAFDPELFYDPYDAPHKILKHPDGKRLSWKNPIYRQQRGWRGWTPVTYDDEIGENLTDYIVEPPSQMLGIATQDNYIRRGTDSILAWLPIELWDRRMQLMEAKALHKQIAANAASGIQTGDGVTKTGEGTVVEKSARSGIKPQVDSEPMGPNTRTVRRQLFSGEEK